MVGKSIGPHRKNLNHPGKILAAIGLVTIGITGVIAENGKNPERIGELNLLKPAKVIIERYEMTDPTTGEAISISQIHQK